MIEFSVGQWTTEIDVLSLSVWALAIFIKVSKPQPWNQMDPNRRCALHQFDGGLKHEFYFSIYWEFRNPIWRTHIFQRGRSTTNQIILIHAMNVGCWALGMADECCGDETRQALGFDECLPAEVLCEDLPKEVKDPTPILSVSGGFLNDG